MIEHVLTRVPTFLSKLFFRSFESQHEYVEEIEKIRNANPQRPIVIGIINGGMIEFLALRFFFYNRFKRNFRINTGTGYPKFIIEPPLVTLKRILAFFKLCRRPSSRAQHCVDELNSGNAVVVNFRNSELTQYYETPESERHLKYISSQVQDLLFVGTVFIWRRHGMVMDDKKTDFTSKIYKFIKAPFVIIWHSLLGDPYNPRGLRKIFLMIRGYTRSTIRVATILDANDFAPRAIRRKLYTATQREKRSVIGPLYKPVKSLEEQITREASFKEIVKKVALERDMTEKNVYKKARNYFKEIAADYNYFFLETIGWVLKKVFTNIYDGIQYKKEDLERIRELTKKGSVVFIPNHRSYLDFLLFSFLLYDEHMACPHIVAGKNLDIWPVGGLLRKGGAFFIRRTFKGNVLYSEILKRYIYTLLNNKINVQVFIEGTRSRNGKLAPPRYGIIKMIVDAMVDKKISEKVFLVPVSLNYDKVTEEKAHQRELEGGEKPKENAINFVKSSSKILKSSYGKVHVGFAEEIDLETYIEKNLPTPEQKKFGIQKLAFEICHRINSATPITAIAMICSVLLAKPGSSMSHRELKLWLERLKNDISHFNFPVSKGLQESFDSDIQKAIKRLIHERIIESYTHEDGLGLKIPAKHRVRALYYKNSCIHVILKPAFAALFDNSNQRTQLRNLLEFEFFFSKRTEFESQISKLPKNLAFDFYPHLIDDFLECIELGLRFLLKQSGMTLEKKEWRQKVMRYATQEIAEENVTRTYGMNTQSFGAFIDLAINEKWLTSSTVDPLKTYVNNKQKIQDRLNFVKLTRSKVKKWDLVKACLETQNF